jgi:hypothetical protein
MVRVLGQPPSLLVIVVRDDVIRISCPEGCRLRATYSSFGVCLHDFGAKMKAQRYSNDVDVVNSEAGAAMGRRHEEVENWSIDFV